MTLDEALDRLGRSKFRSRFRLTASDRAYMDRVGLETIERHAADFVRERLASAVPPNDGRQTPMHGHPAFKAMHATATCCRGCMAKWWKVPQGRPLSPSLQTKAVRLIMAWIIRNQTCPYHRQTRPRSVSPVA